MNFKKLNLKIFLKNFGGGAGVLRKGRGAVVNFMMLAKMANSHMKN